MSDHQLSNADKYSEALASNIIVSSNQLFNADNSVQTSSSELPTPSHFVETCSLSAEPESQSQSQSLNLSLPVCSHPHVAETNSLSEESELQLLNSSHAVASFLPACSSEPLKQDVVPFSSFELHTSLLVETFSPLDDLESQRINLLHSTGPSSALSPVAFNPSSLFDDFDFFNEVDHLVEEDFATKDSSSFNPISPLLSRDVVNEISHATHST